MKNRDDFRLNTEKQILESVAKEVKNGREFLNAIDEKITEMIFG